MWHWYIIFRTNISRQSTLNKAPTVKNYKDQACIEHCTQQSAASAVSSMVMSSEDDSQALLVGAGSACWVSPSGLSEELSSSDKDLPRKDSMLEGAFQESSGWTAGSNSTPLTLEHLPQPSSSSEYESRRGLIDCNKQILGRRGRGRLFSKGFNKPSCDALQVQKLDLQLKEHLKAKGKDGSENLSPTSSLPRFIPSSPHKMQRPWERGDLLRRHIEMENSAMLPTEKGWNDHNILKGYLPFCPYSSSPPILLHGVCSWLCSGLEGIHLTTLVCMMVVPSSLMSDRGIYTI